MIFATSRLVLRDLVDADAAFLVALLNEPSFLAHIGDRGVRDEAGARRYLDDGPRASYRTHGFGLWCVTKRADETPIGICGILRRAELSAPDLGYAFLAAHRGQGLAREAAVGTMAFAREHLGISRLLAIVNPSNAPSIHLLERVGFELRGAAPNPRSDAPLLLYEWNA